MLGRPLPNTALLVRVPDAHRARCRSTALIRALAERFRGEILERNTALVERAAGTAGPGRGNGGRRRMRKALEGSQAIAQAVALCRPQVIAAYPITPQTHIVEQHRQAGRRRRA
jgi:hypothetical protein